LDKLVLFNQQTKGNHKMNVIVKDALFSKLVECVEDYKRELDQTVKCLHAQEEIDSMESTIAELESLALFCRRILKAAEHSRTVKGQIERFEPVQVSEGTLAQLRRRK